MSRHSDTLSWFRETRTVSALTPCCCVLSVLSREPTYKSYSTVDLTYNLPHTRRTRSPLHLTYNLPYTRRTRSPLHLTYNLPYTRRTRSPLHHGCS